MGVTRGGVFVPSPTAYDYVGEPGVDSAFPQLTADATDSIRIVTRVPANAEIDDFDAFYAVLSANSGSVSFDITVKNLRTSLVIATVSTTVTVAAFRSYEFAMTKSNPFLPGDFIEIVFARTSGAALWLLAAKGESSAAPATPNNGCQFPTATDSTGDVRNRFNTPAAFFTWLDSDLNDVIEWMPGMFPYHSISAQSGTMYFVGNLIEMPLSDRRPSGVWIGSGVADTDMTVKIFAEPADPNDFTELYSISYPSVSGTLLDKLVYLPFDGSQPVLEKGTSYIVGIGTGLAPALPSKRLYGVTWLHQQIGPAWTIGPPRPYSSFSSKVFGRDVVSAGVWRELGPPINYELGFVFEESEA